MIVVMKQYEEDLFDGYKVQCTIVPMGVDYAVSVYGGSRSHAGCAVMAISRPSLTGKGRSCTSSVLNAVGHKDETVARFFAEAIAKEKNCTVVCTCGIHVDDITKEQLQSVIDCSERLLGSVLADLKEQ